MSLIYRTSHRAEYVHVTDNDCDPLGRAGPVDGWYRAAEQPSSATRFGVRPLSPDEWRAVLDAGAEGDTHGQVVLAAMTGLVTIDGAAPPGDLSQGIVQEVGALVIALTSHPTTGRSSSSTAGPSTDSSDTVPSAA